MERVRILAADTDRHHAFLGFVDVVFSGSKTESWMSWRDRGGWTRGYEVFALLDAGTIVATIGRSSMQLLIEGQDRVGHQLGAVAVAESHRGRGLARHLMDWVLGSLDAADQPVILFANSRVHDFYPRFGFQRLPQQRSVATVVLHPSGTQASSCDLSDATDRARLADLCARARPTQGRLTARDYGCLALWNLTCAPVTLAWLPNHDAAVAFTVEEERLVVHDVITVRPFDLRLAAPALIAQPVTSVELLIDPEDFWPSMAYSTLDDNDSPLFVRGAAAKIDGPVQFTPLART